MTKRAGTEETLQLLRQASSGCCTICTRSPRVVLSACWTTSSTCRMRKFPVLMQYTGVLLQSFVKGGQLHMGCMCSNEDSKLMLISTLARKWLLNAGGLQGLSGQLQTQPCWGLSTLEH